MSPRYFPAFFHFGSRIFFSYNFNVCVISCFFLSMRRISTIVQANWDLPETNGGHFRVPRTHFEREYHPPYSLGRLYIPQPDPLRYTSGVLYKKKDVNCKLNGHFPTFFPYSIPFQGRLTCEAHKLQILEKFGTGYCTVYVQPY